MAGTIRDAVRLLLRSATLYPVNQADWPIADIASVPSASVIDGWLSQANDKHFSAIVREHLANIESRTPSLAAFSYSSDRRTYDLHHTLRSVRAQVPKLARFLGRINQPSVLIAYSVGGAIALLALRRMVEQDGPEAVRERLPCIILVHPAIGGAEELRMYLANDGLLRPGFVPPIIRNLAYATSRFPTEARQMIPELLDAGVSVVLLQCPNDRLVPPPVLNDARLWTTPFVIRDDPYLEHIRLRTLDEALNLQYYVGKPFITWT
jgi:hypothetical protein